MSILISTISFCIRAYLCYLTIDGIPVLANPIANEIWGEVFSLYSLLMIISRATVVMFYKKGEAPVFGAICYFCIYLVYLAITYGVLVVLTKNGILPIKI